MEVAGTTVFRQVPCFSSNSSGLQSFSQSLFCSKQQPNRKSLIALASCHEFSDKGHLQYYDCSPRMAIKEKEMKKQLKLLKGLSKNLSVFSDMGFGLNLDDNGLDAQVRGKMISEATEVLVGQLQKLKAEKMELKRIKKEEKVKKKAAKMMECKSKEEESSSSSSSESECEKINVSHGEEATSSSLLVVDDNEVVENISSMSLSLNNNKDNTSKIEVCMGGKCKKSGAAMLLENFQKAVGVVEESAIAVVGCKCMGKCRDGPNVKVIVNNNSNSLGLGLCMGVRLEDVDSIVNDYLFPPNRNTTIPTAPAM